MRVQLDTFDLPKIDGMFIPLALTALCAYVGDINPMCCTYLLY